MASASKNLINNKILASIGTNNKNRKKMSALAYQHNLILNNKKGSYEAFSDLSSNISSNNLTCSDLDTTNNTNNSGNGNDSKLHRKKLIKCILREDLDLLVCVYFLY